MQDDMLHPVSSGCRGTWGLQTTSSSAQAGVLMTSFKCERVGVAGSMVTPSPLGSASKLASGRNHSALAQLARAYHQSVPTPEEMVFLFLKNQ